MELMRGCPHTKSGLDEDFLQVFSLGALALVRVVSTPFLSARHLLVRYMLRSRAVRRADAEQ
jgi:hypothetical protein